MSLNFFWFAVAAIIGALDLYFSNVSFLIVAAACFITGMFSFFIGSVYVQIAILVMFALFMLFVYNNMQGNAQEESLSSDRLKRWVGKPVIVHEWQDNRYATVQFNGKLWKAEIAFNVDSKLPPGTYFIWKVLPNKLVLMQP
ncbi:MAG: hypothetical protein LUC43_08465 [Burkholderiales bacterium]|nr:hypothetical protein [Burkholderiales bacterium]